MPQELIIAARGQGSGGGGQFTPGGGVSGVPGGGLGGSPGRGGTAPGNSAPGTPGKLPSGGASSGVPSAFPSPAVPSRFDPSDFIPNQVPSRGNIRQRVEDGIGDRKGSSSELRRGQQSQLDQNKRDAERKRSTVDREVRSRREREGREAYQRQRERERQYSPSPSPTVPPRSAPNSPGSRRGVPSPAPGSRNSPFRNLPSSRPVDGSPPDNIPSGDLTPDAACYLFGRCSPTQRPSLKLQRPFEGGQIAGRQYFWVLNVVIDELQLGGVYKEKTIQFGFAVLIGRLRNLRLVVTGSVFNIFINSEVTDTNPVGVEKFLGGVNDSIFTRFKRYTLSLTPLTPKPGTPTVPPFPGDEIEYDYWLAPANNPVPIPLAIPTSAPIPYPHPNPNIKPDLQPQPLLPPQPLPQPNPSPYPAPAPAPIPVSPGTLPSQSPSTLGNPNQNPDLDGFTPTSPIPPSNPNVPPVPPVPCPPGCLGNSPMQCISVDPKFAPLSVPIFLGCDAVTGEPLRGNKLVQVLDGTQSSTLEMFERLYNLEALQCVNPIEESLSNLVETELLSGVSMPGESVYYSVLQTNRNIGYKLVIDSYDASNVRAYKLSDPVSAELGLGNIGLVDSDGAYRGRRIDVFTLKTIVEANDIEYSHRVRISLKFGVSFTLYKLTKPG